MNGQGCKTWQLPSQSERGAAPLKIHIRCLHLRSLPDIRCIQNAKERTSEEQDGRPLGKGAGRVVAEAQPRTMRVHLLVHHGSRVPHDRVSSSWDDFQDSVG